ncbi:group I truncated hemoglobin [Alkalimarinus sediminis]|uniref:Group 1 truncated hemoglobin n=1 Tax=Alkalimarinus sediminis TaxID=1632866 RepID=A0A9E8HJ30_9ALTE|nr:group 1 truncated hemoglobin [Alkalimarinus sediminis]UZW74277.1 group 1 truncated hemoglobin [Alkalimarinus sediminis]
MSKVRFMLLIPILLLCWSCSSHSLLDRDSNQTLFNRIGGQPVLEKLVNNLVKNIGQDDVIFHFFADSNVTRFKDNLYIHLCSVADGPCHYGGDSMVDIHTGMNIREGDFNHLVELMITAMESSGIAYPLQNELLSRLVPLRNEIIKI